MEEIEAKDESGTETLGFLGSPAIRVNGLDIEPAHAQPSLLAFACRRYPDGLPSEEMIRAALGEARQA